MGWVAAGGWRLTAPLAGALVTYTNLLPPAVGVALCSAALQAAIPASLEYRRRLLGVLQARSAERRDLVAALVMAVRNVQRQFNMQRLPPRLVLDCVVAESAESQAKRVACAPPASGAEGEEEEWFALWNLVEGWRWLLLGGDAGLGECRAHAVSQGNEIVRLLTQAFFTAPQRSLGAWKAGEMVVEALPADALDAEAQGWVDFYAAWTLQARLSRLVEHAAEVCLAATARARDAVKPQEKALLRARRDKLVAEWTERVSPAALALCEGVAKLLRVPGGGWLAEHAALRQECRGHDRRVAGRDQAGERGGGQAAPPGAGYGRAGGPQGQRELLWKEPGRAVPGEVRGQRAPARQAGGQRVCGVAGRVDKCLQQQQHIYKMRHPPSRPRGQRIKFQ
jgi:hypothetical protein